MGMTLVIGFGILIWALLAILLALFVGRMSALRDRQRPSAGPVASMEDESGEGTESPPERPRSLLRNLTWR